MKRIFPSYPAAIASGALGGPLLVFGARLIERTSGSAWLLPLWTIVAFFIPVIYATHDRAEARRWREEHGLFGSMIFPASKEAFRRLYIPTWKRMAVWFVSVVASFMLLKLVGVNL